MARTFIGELVLKLKDEMSGAAKQAATNLDHSIDNIEKAARKLDGYSWGGKFHEKLVKLGADAQLIERLNSSWNKLNDTIRTKNLSPADSSKELENWKLATLGHLTTIQADLDKHMKVSEEKARNFKRRMGELMQPAMVAMGGYTGFYLAGTGIREALTAASSKARTNTRMDLANIPPADIEAMQKNAAALSTKYGAVDETSILELNKTAYALMGGNLERAQAVMEQLVRTFIADMNATSVQKAGENLSSALKAMDNLNINQGKDGGVADIAKIFEGWTKAKQIEGKDIDIGGLLQFAQHAKTAKYALSKDFLEYVLPALGQDTGFSSFGDQLSGMFSNFVTPTGKGKNAVYLHRQEELGLREKDGTLIQRDLFTSNPYQWITSVLKPLLEKSGVDMKNAGAVSEAVKKLMSNPRAAAAVIGMLEAQAQIDKNIAMYRGAKGTDGVEDIRAKDPFVALESFYASLRNFSAAVLPMEQVAGVLNTLADSINHLKDLWKEGDLLTKSGILGAGGLAGVGLYKIVSGIMSLATAGPALNAAAASLEAAALSLKGAGAADIVDDIGGKAGKKGGLFSKLGGLLPWIGTVVKSASIPAAAGTIAYNALENTPHEGMESAQKNNPNLMVDMENQRKYDAQFPGGFEGGMHRAWSGSGPMPESMADNRLVNPYKVALDFMERRILMEEETRRRESESRYRRRSKWEPKTDHIPIPGARPEGAGEKSTVKVVADNKPSVQAVERPVLPPVVDLSAASLEAMQRRQQMEDVTRPGSSKDDTPGVSQYFEQPTAEQKPIVIDHQSVDDRTAAAYQQNADTRQAAGVSSNPQVKPDVDMSSADAAAAQAQAIGQQIAQAMSVSATPQINLGQLQQAVALAQRFISLMQSAGAAAANARASVSSEMRRNFSDHGVKP